MQKTLNGLLFWLLAIFFTLICSFCNQLFRCHFLSHTVIKSRGVHEIILCRGALPRGLNHHPFHIPSTGKCFLFHAPIQNGYCISICFSLSSGGFRPSPKVGGGGGGGGGRNSRFHKEHVNKFRLGNHNLRIETGRHNKTPENLRICSLRH